MKMTFAKERIYNPICMLIIGFLLGIASRLLDIYTQNLGNIFSQFSIWILIGTWISIRSSTPKKAMCNILLFCIGMLATYYITASLTHGVYGKIYIIGWTIFALCSPFFAWCVCFSMRRGLFSLALRCCIVIFSFAAAIVFFDGPRFYDYIINGILIYILFVRHF